MNKINIKVEINCENKIKDAIKEHEKDALGFDLLSYVKQELNKEMNYILKQVKFVILQNEEYEKYQPEVKSWKVSSEV